MPKLPLNQVLQGDCRKIMKSFPDQSIHTIVTDPLWPNVLKELPGSEDPYGTFAEAVVEFVRIARTLVIHLGCTSDPRFLASIPRTVPFIRTCWLRYNFPTYRGRILIGSDVAYIFGRLPQRKENKIIPGEIVSKSYGGPIIRKKRKHPTPRHIDHVLGLVKYFSNPGEIVLDPFCGSGTTLRAAKYLGRQFIGIDISEKFVGLSQESIQQELLF